MANETRKSGPLPERPLPGPVSDPFDTGAQIGSAEMKVIQPVELHPLGSMYQGDPDTYDGSVQLTNMLPDDLPPGCDMKKWQYIQVNNDHRAVPTGLRDLLASTKAFRPVSPSNHPEIDPNLFTGGKLEMHDIHIWYGPRAAYQNYAKAKRTPNNERFYGKVAGKDVKLEGAGPMRVRQSGSISAAGESVAGALNDGHEAFRESMEGIARKVERGG